MCWRSESRDRLFSECAFRRRVWGVIMVLMESSHGTVCWEVELQWVCWVRLGKGIKHKYYDIHYGLLLFILCDMSLIGDCMESGS